MKSHLIEALGRGAVAAIEAYEKAIFDYCQECVQTVQPSYAVIEAPKIQIADRLLEELGLPLGPQAELERQTSEWQRQKIASRKLGRPKNRPYLSRRLRWKIFKRDGFKCVQCNFDDNLTIDHITPIIRGGSNEESNLQTLCQPCNAKKGTR